MKESYERVYVLDDGTEVTSRLSLSSAILNKVSSKERLTAASAYMYNDVAKAARDEGKSIKTVRPNNLYDMPVETIDVLQDVSNDFHLAKVTSANIFKSILGKKRHVLFVRFTVFGGTYNGAEISIRATLPDSNLDDEFMFESRCDEVNKLLDAINCEKIDFNDSTICDTIRLYPQKEDLCIIGFRTYTESYQAETHMPIKVETTISKEMN